MSDGFAHTAKVGVTTPRPAPPNWPPHWPDPDPDVPDPDDPYPIPPGFPEDVPVIDFTCTLTIPATASFYGDVSVEVEYLDALAAPASALEFHVIRVKAVKTSDNSVVRLRKEVADPFTNFVHYIVGLYDTTKYGIDVTLFMELVLADGGEDVKFTADLLTVFPFETCTGTTEIADWLSPYANYQVDDLTQGWVDTDTANPIVGSDQMTPWPDSSGNGRDMSEIAANTALFYTRWTSGLYIPQGHASTDPGRSSYNVHAEVLTLLKTGNFSIHLGFGGIAGGSHPGHIGYIIGVTKDASAVDELFHLRATTTDWLIQASDGGANQDAVSITRGDYLTGRAQVTVVFNLTAGKVDVYEDGVFTGTGTLTAAAWANMGNCNDGKFGSTGFDTTGMEGEVPAVLFYNRLLLPAEIVTLNSNINALY